ncbi:hypothetical protein M9H77_26974 [Catharanthus roseus]|uniref:Uncharacterized protein n=1 Tax=Catharanthus roseus TaxID=4058 RepID=A0ACC0ABP6_CATRO|nr:hypothetical protein M9H77_26974 [Catharanthus roseus]
MKRRQEQSEKTENRAINYKSANLPHEIKSLLMKISDKILATRIWVKGFNSSLMYVLDYIKDMNKAAKIFEKEANIHRLMCWNFALFGSMGMPEMNNQQIFSAIQIPSRMNQETAATL